MKKSNYKFQTFAEYLIHPEDKVAILRHDIDSKPYNALTIAKIENDFKIRSTFYFQVSKKVYSPFIIKKISELGHEIGYHYMDVDQVIQKRNFKIKNGLDRNDLINESYKSFLSNLAKIRKISEIKTICMHGSPLSKYDNRIIWEKYNYKDLGIIGDPYYDIDFNVFAYFTDTGRRWNGEKFSIRDKVDSKYNFSFRSTDDIIDNIDSIPDKVMFTIHPERWTNNLWYWSKQFILQHIKNYIKQIIIIKRNNS